MSDLADRVRWTAQPRSHDLGVVYSWGVNDDGALGRKADRYGTSTSLASSRSIKVLGRPSRSCRYRPATATQWPFPWRKCYGARTRTLRANASLGTRMDLPSAKRNQQTEPLLLEGFRVLSQTSVVAQLIPWQDAPVAAVQLGIGTQGQLGRPRPGIAGCRAGEYKLEGIHNEHLYPSSVLLSGKSVTNVKVIGCGAYHSLFYQSVAGRVFGFGLNNYGQLGLGDEETRLEPVSIQALEGKRISALDGGEHFSMALGLDGSLHSFGRGDSGQLGRKGPDSRGMIKSGYFDNTLASSRTFRKED